MFHYRVLGCLEAVCTASRRCNLLQTVAGWMFRLKLLQTVSDRCNQLQNARNRQFSRLARPSSFPKEVREHAVTDGLASTSTPQTNKFGPGPLALPPFIITGNQRGQGCRRLGRDRGGPRERNEAPGGLGGSKARRLADSLSPIPGLCFAYKAAAEVDLRACSATAAATGDRSVDRSRCSDSRPVPESSRAAGKEEVSSV